MQIVEEMVKIATSDTFYANVAGNLIVIGCLRVGRDGILLQSMKTIFD